MDHLLLKATTTATDQGLFEAVISTSGVDRERDVVDPEGMVRALRKWVPGGKKLPLAWNHSAKAEDQIGWIDPSSARAAGGEVLASGWIDQSTEVGAHAWRLVKAGTLGFSFGYLALKGEPRKGGGKHITELDVFEITATPTPMNNETRVVSFKQMADDAEAEDEDDPAELLGQMISLAQDFIDDEDDPEDVAAMRQIMRGLLALQGAEADEPKALKAPWTTSYVNDLSDSSFLYVAPGGTKDSDGKTVPRSNRMFPYKDASGSVDLPHLRNALARIPQSNLSPSLKDSLTAKAQRILDNQKAVDVTNEKDIPRTVDPLRETAKALTLEFLTDGRADLRKTRKSKPAPKPEPPDFRGYRQQAREQMLSVLSGGTNDE
jgi:hypothetical protein